MNRSVACALLLASAAAAQSFDVASVRASKGTDPRVGYWISGNTGSKLTALNQSLMQLIERAYGMNEYQISGPDWLKGPKYEVKAKLSPGMPREEVAAAMRTLLADRFKMVAHRETRELPLYELVVAKGGSKLKPAEGRGTTTQIRGLYKARNESMARLCDTLSRVLLRAVVDRTGLAGKYDFVVDYAPADPHFSDPAGAVSIFTAVQNQLGLKLESRKGPVEVLVVDSAQRLPTAN